MKKLLFLIVSAFCFSTLFSQIPGFTFARPTSGFGLERAWATSIDLNGNIFTAGEFQGIPDFDPGPGTFTLSAPTGTPHTFISKLNSAGNFIWACQFTGGTSYAYSITNDASGNVYTTGYFSGTVDFDPGPGTYTLFSGITYGRVYVSKLDVNGNFVYAKMFNTIGGGGQGNSLATDPFRNLYIAGSFQGVGDFDPGPGTFTLASAGSGGMYTVKLDSVGNFIWGLTMEGTGEEGANELALDVSGNVYITGNFANTVDFDPGPGTYTLSSASYSIAEVYVSKLNSSGNFIWAKKFGGNTIVPRSVAVNTIGEVYVSGDFKGTSDCDPGPGTYTIMSNSNTNDLFINKLDATGNFIWAVSMGSSWVDFNYAMTLSPNGNVFTAGIFTTTMDFDPGPGTFTLSGSSGAGYISELSPAGNFIWAGTYNGVCSIYDIKSDALGNIYNSGEFNTIADFDPGPGITSYTFTGGTGDAFVQKMCTSAPLTPTIISGPSGTSCAGSVLTYTSSLSISAASYSWNLPAGWTGTSNTSILTATAGTSGVFSVTAINGCGTSPSQTLNVVVNPLPPVSASTSSVSVCSGSSGCLFGTGATTYTWAGPCGFSSLSQNPCFPFASFCQCTYTLWGTDVNGCTNTATTCINVMSNPTITASASNTLICTGQTATLTSNGALTYSWSTSASGSVIAVSPTINTTYSVTGFDVNGCSGVASITQSVSACTSINEHSEQFGFSIIPNPSSGEITVSIDKLSENLSMEVYNTIGELIIQEKIIAAKTKINLSEQVNGVYSIRIIENGKSVYYSKIIKQ